MDEAHRGLRAVGNEVGSALNVVKDVAPRILHLQLSDVAAQRIHQSMGAPLSPPLTPPPPLPPPLGEYDPGY